MEPPLEITRLTNHTLADRAFERLETAIVTGEIPPGAKITEVELARSLGISRGPLREAIRRLEGRKLLERVPHVGARVVTWSSETLIDLFHIREVLEGLACRLAAEQITKAELTELEAVLEQHHRDTRLQEGESYFQTAGDLDFHFRIARVSGNKKLVDILCGDLYSLLRVYRYRSGATPGRARQAFDEHRGILAAIRDRKPELAETRMRAHIAHARAILSRTRD
jgi:DNA-binding GntR family transcriptional regulator